MGPSTPRTLSHLLTDRAEQHPAAAFGTVEAPTTLGEAVETARRVAASLRALGVRPGDRVALVGTTSTSYLVAWAALQLAGVEAALFDPTHPPALRGRLLEGLAPRAVVWCGVAVERGAAPGTVHVDAGRVAEGWLGVGATPTLLAADDGQRPGHARRARDVAGYMHTSGTTGLPKLCAQSHEYFLRLGRFVADGLALHEGDTVHAPLPMFHVNPLGYGVVGGLTGHAAVLGAERFSARAFWPTVRRIGATVLVLHAPPIEILKRATTAADAEGHRVRAQLFADEVFMDRFAVPFGLSVYGSTEVGGLSHSWGWRRGEGTATTGGISRYGGRARSEIEWCLAADGEILVRATRPGVLITGYLGPDGTDLPLDGDGWFRTGDRGQQDEAGNLVFVERAADAIRVKGEHVPIDFVEEQLRAVAGLEDLALWKRPSALVDDEVVLYVVGAAIPVTAIRTAIAGLPAGFRPVAVTRVGELPRDAGVGKVRRRLLPGLAPLEHVELAPG